MLTSKKRLFLLCATIIVVISVGLAIAKMASEVSSSDSQTPLAHESFEKTGKTTHITLIYPIAGDCCSLPLTCIEFEDGDYCQFYGIFKNIKEGKTYRIIYQKQDRICCNDDNSFKGIKTSTVNVIQEIEEISP